MARSQDSISGALLRGCWSVSDCCHVNDATLCCLVPSASVEAMEKTSRASQVLVTAVYLCTS